MSENTGLFARLRELAEKDAVPMHMPGHKRNTEGVPFLEKLGARYDITEIDGFDELHDPKSILKDAMERAARLWRSKRSFFLVNGSTGGILAAIRAAATLSGGKLIMARSCHKSAYNAALICALEPVYLVPSAIPGYGFCGSITPESVERAVRENPGTPVIITSPTYEGVISDIAAIAEICRAFASPLIVDEAHGAHLDLSPHFTGGAVAAGADITVQSVHKTLTGLTQAAILHLNGDLIAPEAMQNALSIFQTSSPSYPIMASIDGTVDLLETQGAELFSAWKTRLDRFDERVTELQTLRIPGHSEPFDRSGEVFGFDRSKIVISCADAGITGVELMAALRKRFSIECEMGEEGYCVAMSGILDRDEHMKRLADALCALDREIHRASPRITPPLPIPPRRMGAGAALGMPKESLPLRDATGKTAAEYVWAYPPGIPLVVPGEELTAEMVSVLIALSKAGVALKSDSGGVPQTVMTIKS